MPEDHLAWRLSEVVDQLDLSAIESAGLRGESRGRPGYSPRMMAKVLLYGYCVGVASSRRIEKATYADVAFRVLSGDQHPDHDSIASFRKTHLKALAGLFSQVLVLCQRAGLVSLEHIAIDGTKIQANASKHKAMSYARMAPTERRLEAEMEALLREAERVDAEEDARYGVGRRGDELPAELQRRSSRLAKIREAKAALEAEAREAAQARKAEVEEPLAERARREEATGKKARGRAPEAPDPETAQPEPKAQRNFTDPESRIMPDGGRKGSFVQGYNAQIAVDGARQIIVATAVVQETNDKEQLAPMARKVIANVGRLANVTTADAGYFSEKAVSDEALATTHLLVPPNRIKHDELEGGNPPPVKDGDTEAALMRLNLQLPANRDLYKMRKAIAEPVFGQIKEIRGFRRFLLRGWEKVCAEFDLIALTHNLLKLIRYGKTPRLGWAG